MAQEIQSDIGITHTCHEPINFHIVPVTYRRFSALQQTGDFQLLKRKALIRCSRKYILHVKPNFKLSFSEKSPIIKK